jgi:hypothetical protein
MPRFVITAFCASTACPCQERPRNTAYRTRGSSTPARKASGRGRARALSAPRSRAPRRRCAMAAPQSLGDLVGMEYTRGGPGEADARGATLVEKHNERMQTEREDRAVEKVRARARMRPALLAPARTAHAVPRQAANPRGVHARRAPCASRALRSLEPLQRGPPTAAHPPPPPLARPAPSAALCRSCPP